MTTVERDKAAQEATHKRPDDRRDEERSSYLPGDPQARAWLRRAIIAVVLGVLLAIFVNIPVGVVVAVLSVIGDVVRVSRKESSVEAWRKPSQAERKTERQLRSMEKA